MSMKKSLMREAHSIFQINRWIIRRGDLIQKLTRAKNNLYRYRIIDILIRELF